MLFCSEKWENCNKNEEKDRKWGKRTKMRKKNQTSGKNWTKTEKKFFHQLNLGMVKRIICWPNDKHKNAYISNSFSDNSAWLCWCNVMLFQSEKIGLRMERWAKKAACLTMFQTFFQTIKNCFAFFSFPLKTNTQIFTLLSAINNQSEENVRVHNKLHI